MVFAKIFTETQIPDKKFTTPVTSPYCKAYAMSKTNAIMMPAKLALFLAYFLRISPPLF